MSKSVAKTLKVFVNEIAPDGTVGVIYAEHDVSSIPEPAFWPILGIMLTGLCVIKRYKSN